MGTTVGAIVISYDVNKLHADVKERMEGLGYADNWHYPNKPTFEMPNTTLWHENKSSDAAISDIKSICRQLGVTLHKAIAVFATEFAGV